VHATVAQQHHRQCQGVDVRCPQRVKQFYGHAGPVWCLWFDPEEDLLLSGGYDATVKVWSLSGERCEATLRGHDGWVRSLEVLQASRRVVSGGSDGVLKIWNLATRQNVHSTRPPNNDPRHSTHCLAAIEQQEALITGHSGMHHLQRWDLATMERAETFIGHDDDIYAIHTDGPSSLLVSGSKDRTLKVWDTRTSSSRPGGCVATLSGHTGAVLDLKLRGNRIVSASMDKTVRMWDIREPRVPLATLEGHSEEVHCVDFCDHLVLSGSRDTALKVWTVL
jgi:WD40 repeat protein